MFRLFHALPRNDTRQKRMKTAGLRGVEVRALREPQKDKNAQHDDTRVDFAAGR